MSESLSQNIKKKEKNLAKLNNGGEVKALLLEINGQFKDNIVKKRITPKTVKKKRSTLLDSGAGMGGITTIFRNGIIKTGNFYAYMQNHLKGTKFLPIRNWLKKPPQLDATMQAWIRNFMRK